MPLLVICQKGRTANWYSPPVSPVSALYSVRIREAVFQSSNISQFPHLLTPRLDISLHHPHVFFDIIIFFFSFTTKLLYCTMSFPLHPEFTLV